MKMSDYEIKSVNFNGFNTIPTIDENNNKFVWRDENKLNKFKVSQLILMN